MPDHYTGIPETGTSTGRRFPAAALFPAATLFPTEDWFAAWRAQLATVPLAEPAAAGTSVLVVAGWPRWDYSIGVNPAVEATPLLEAGTSLYLEGVTVVTAEDVLPPDTCGGRTAMLLVDPLARDHGTDACLWVPVDRAVGAVRLAQAGEWSAARLNATLCTVADAINLLAGELVVTYEGAVPVVSGTWDADEGIRAAALYVNDGAGLLAPALLPRDAAAGTAGLVFQAAHVGDTGPSAVNTNDAWPVLYDIEQALVAAGWLLEAD